MKGSLEKLEWENTTRLLYFKHRGDLTKILPDLRERYSNVDSVEERFTAAFVDKIIKKFKRKEKANSPFVATYIMEYVFMGTKQRELLWHTEDEELGEFKYQYRSACCDAAANIRHNAEGVDIATCLKCNKICNAYRVPNLQVLEFQRKIRGEQRQDEIALVQALDSLGFGGPKAPILKQNIHQNIVQLPGRPSKKRKQVSATEVKNLPDNDQKLLESMEDMDPRDRETVRKRLEMMRREVVGDGWPDEETQE